jgi:hypothetical protein
VRTSDPVGAVGWSVDPDNTSASNVVHCYVDGPAGSGRFLGGVTANLPSPNIAYPGNHQFLMPIPADLRNNLTHQMYCYGLDVTGGDSPTLLTGSPKPFRFSTETIGWIQDVNFLVGNNPEAVATVYGEVGGWSLDTDLPGNSNPVHFYIDGLAGVGTYVGQTLANIPRPDVNTVTGYPGDHGFSYFIPDQYRDGLNHTIYAYGIDLTGGQPKLLQGSPKLFNLNTRVSTLTFEPLSTTTIRSVIDTNPNTGSGQRIFPDKDDPNAATDPYTHATVQVKALITPVKQNVTVYFQSYDLDDPSANMLPLDDDTGPDTGNDNRGTPNSGTLRVTSALTDASGIATVNFTTTMQPGDNFAVAASTDTAYLGTITIDGTNLKDNANTQIPATLACTSSAVNACRTDMLTVWRRLHMEVDSMTQGNGNFVRGDISGTAKIKVGGSKTFNVMANDLEVNRYENTRMVLAPITKYLDIISNTVNTITVKNSTSSDITLTNNINFELLNQSSDTSTVGNVPIGQTITPMQMVTLNINGTPLRIDTFANGQMFLTPALTSLTITSNTVNTVTVTNNTGAVVQLSDPFTHFRLYDDDDYNSSNTPATLNGDEGEPIVRFPDTFKHLSDSLTGGTFADGTPMNILASAYILPEYNWAENVKHYNQSDVDFNTNVEQTEGPILYAPLLGTDERNSKNDEKDNFWVSYFIIAYQGQQSADADGTSSGMLEAVEEGLTLSNTVCDCYNSTVCPRNGVSVCTTYPVGGNVSLIYEESIRDLDKYQATLPPADFSIKGSEVTAPHELGHQFGLRGDVAGTLFNIMDYPNNSTPLRVKLHPEHINIMRWRIKSPGI